MRAVNQVFLGPSPPTTRQCPGRKALAIPVALWLALIGSAPCGAGAPCGTFNMWDAALHDHATGWPKCLAVDDIPWVRPRGTLTRLGHTTGGGGGIASGTGGIDALSHLPGRAPASLRGTGVAPDGVILCLVTDSVDEWAERLTAEGVRLEKPPTLNPRYNIYHLFCRDPDGHLVEIQQFCDPRQPPPPHSLQSPPFCQAGPPPPPQGGLTVMK